MKEAVKAVVAIDRIIVLTVRNTVYEYKDGGLTQITLPEMVVDISANNGNVIYQTVSEKTYVSGSNIYGELGVRKSSRSFYTRTCK